ncbi:hypothetical protein HOC35_01825 [Candidatus Woesearchaeota archaeon]|jgi:hypothetical protein|nr:hypothetical protein [Candidatus Woesearchaeota archaeon]
MIKKAKKILSKVHPDFCFKLINGGELDNLDGLLQSLKEMDDETFYHHVTSNKSDFANWVKDVLKDEELAEEMSYCNDKVHMEKVVSNRMLELHEKIQKQEDLESFEKLLSSKEEKFVKADSKDIKEKDLDKEVKKKFGIDMTNDMHHKVHLVSWGTLVGLIIGVVLGYLIG